MEHLFRYSDQSTCTLEVTHHCPQTPFPNDPSLQTPGIMGLPGFRKAWEPFGPMEAIKLSIVLILFSKSAGVCS